MLSNCAKLFLILATCSVASCAHYSLTQPANPAPNSGFCDAAMSASLPIQPLKECCNTELTGDQCCTQLYGKYHENNLYYYSETDCRCASSVDCETATENESEVTTTIDATTTTTTTPTKTTTTPTTTTTTPTTTTTTPTTTGRITGTNASLCKPLNRLLNSQPVLNECTYAGVGRIRLEAPSLSTTTCNAVYTVATINNVPQYAFVTSKTCTDGVSQVLNDATVKDVVFFDLGILSLSYPIGGRMIGVAAGSNGLGYLTIGPSYTSNFENIGCQTPACVYNPDMDGDINYSDCTIVSYGASDATTQEQTGLRSVGVRFNPICDNEDDSGAKTICFRSISRDDLICSGDAGAPVYCKAFSNGEDILIGVAGFVTTCGGDDGNVPVIPISS